MPPRAFAVKEISCNLAVIFLILDHISALNLIAFGVKLVQQEGMRLLALNLDGTYNISDDNDTSSAAMPSTGVEDATSHTNEIGNEDCNPLAEEEITNERDISLDQNPFHSLPHLISSSTLIDSLLLMQRHMRFCGWINDNEPNDICTKQLIPTTVMQLEKVIRETDTHSKSRWDEKPK
ncbi:hypothetical protein PVL29_017387 [Vitis rotundifolia]|uniref:Uncharacterized protein n=1 Tax=Vitis rotundifolia TaxID=103349 RepID=A0AA38ZAL7_VITRO|nr:hypothetical protein PVL29_017387 [Vitis rotundifolia]